MLYILAVGHLVKMFYIYGPLLKRYPEAVRNWSTYNCSRSPSKTTPAKQCVLRISFLITAVWWGQYIEVALLLTIADGDSTLDLQIHADLEQMQWNTSRHLICVSKIKS